MLALAIRTERLAHAYGERMGEGVTLNPKL